MVSHAVPLHSVVADETVQRLPLCIILTLYSRLSIKIIFAKYDVRTLHMFVTPTVESKCEEVLT